MTLAGAFKPLNRDDHLNLSRKMKNIFVGCNHTHTFAPRHRKAVASILFPWASPWEKICSEANRSQLHPVLPGVTQ